MKKKITITVLTAALCALLFSGLFFALNENARSVMSGLFGQTSSDVTEPFSEESGSETESEETNPPTDVTETETNETTEKPEEPELINDTLTVSFVGDCMFATNHGAFTPNGFNDTARKKEPSYFLKNFIPMFSSDDFTIANCEGVLSDSELTEKVQTTEIAFWFKGPAYHAEIFKVSGVDLASVCNNHSHDFGQQGSDDTEAALKSAGIIPGSRDTVRYVTIKGQKIGVLCCSLYSYNYVNDILIKLHEMKDNNCDIKILYFHGGIEGARTPEDWKIRACRKLADEGADIIVGTHPHVLQRMEVYNGTPIVYSLGNFCFGGNKRPDRDTAVYQAVFTIETGKLVCREDVIIPCKVYTGTYNVYQPSIITNEAEKNKILDFMEVPEEKTYFD